jgi:predicted transcriptional regulator
MSGTINLHVGSIEEMGERFVGAWHKLAQGAAVDETHLTFFDLETLVSTLSPKRLELLRYVRKHQSGNIADLAKNLGRDYKRVHADVAALIHAGLLVRDEQGIRAPYDSVHTDVSLVS